MRRLPLVFALLAIASPVAAQQRPATPPNDTLTAQQRALERLRGLPSIAQPDTLSVVADSITPQGVTVSQPGTQPTRLPPSNIQRDSVMNLLLGVGGYIGTEYSADSAVYLADRSRLELRGRPQVAREGNQLVADSSIIYNQELSVACGYGDPVLHAVGQAEPLASDTVCFDVRRQLGRAFGATTRVQEGATWNVRCDAYFQGDRLYCHDAIFTDCDETEPHYHFGAKDLKALRGNVIVATNVTLSFDDVPVFWLPFMVQSLSRGRRSGILMPRFGINDIARNSSNYNRRIEDVGVYFAINEYMGAEIAMDWHSENWTAMRGSLDYNWARRFLRGSLTSRRFWPDGGGRQFTLSSNNSWQPDERTQLGVSANYTTSSAFVRTNTLDPRELNRSIDSRASVQRRFDWGSASLGASRRQFLSDNTVSSQIPSLSLNISPLTFFEALPGEDSWYSNVTWSGSGSVNRDRTDVGAANTNPNARTRNSTAANVSSRLSIGRLSFGQGFTFNEQVMDQRTLIGDTIDVILPGSSQQRGNWNTSMSFEQRLIGTSTITPSVSVRGEYMRNDSSGQAIVTAPTRVDVSSSLRVEMFGFWPGVGPFERFRHRLSPSISYSYSPAARADSLQSAIFGLHGVQEQNRISLGLTQTFEAKYRDRSGDETDLGRAPGTDADTTATGTAPDTTDTVQLQRRPGSADTLGGVVLRRRQQVQTVSLLAISTEALVYDFVRARDGQGLINTQIRNSMQSDLLRGMQLSITHDLFRRDTTSLDPGARNFAPHLREVNASFSLNSNSWLSRVFGLGRADTAAARVADAMTPGDTVQSGPAVDRTEAELGLIGTSRRTAPGEPRGPIGTWSASMNYSLFRPRSDLSGMESNQMITGNVYFQPTQNWSVTWSTGYSFTASEFANHVLTLTRTLHDWDANFDFVKAQNGNFSMQFRVHLRANPDVKLDYSQSDIRRPQQF